MKSSQNIPMTLAICLRGAANGISATVLQGRRPSTVESDLSVIEEVATQLDALAGELEAGAQGGEQEPGDEWKAIEWCGHNVAEFDRYEGKHYIKWIADDLTRHETVGTDWRDAVTKAMAEDAASEQASEVANG